ncbi:MULTISPECIES: class I SAM-dependent methyltransferase [Serratia]|uniref:class I SAM-dependent methyltransferase n=1 Tax=Serratia TaxID=613 RepID=UPI00074556C0|nr:MULTISPECIES: class I SAM-dependent methyltransferase [Serratia]CUY78474.1 bifunctional 3-demethylubiquinone-9 3-methyltransferase/ 2-octaprenyl-6-hydroxy phenol methylase [Serratia marcescens]CUY97300.1 bifunctional 3-demethylubiquinone-9 3-methyltransferase/ 2-octaprenyl-6-hydroxy phenol methylase [Serratia marcescens]CUZ18502.1 bifunctional 3-demethylubiquinone-9 3-methyltransferase/ 2-octaprenyl-6-hydroxy phenol methylase [Serratia marcescens]CUZ25399.1 bifunctional 3-demethylubiquinone-
MLLDKNIYAFRENTGIWAKPDYAGIPYSDGDTQENLLLSIIQNTQDRSVSSAELKAQCTDWVTTYHFSSLRSNLLRPLKSILQPGTKILEVGAGCGAITRFLGEMGCEVVALEGSLRRAAIARTRTEGLDNVTVVSERFDDFESDVLFDVITLIGVLEYSNLFSQGEDSAVSMLEKIKKRLKPGGKLIIAIENQLGLKYFSGAREDHLGQAMYGIEGRYTKEQAETFGHHILKQKLVSIGLQAIETLLPFPDYKLPVSVVTSNGASDPNFDASVFAAQSVRADMQLPEKLNFVLELAWPIVFKNNLACELSNSFLLVASDESSELIDKDLLAIHYGSERYSPFYKETVFSKDENEEIKVKRHLLSPGVAIENDFVDFKLDGFEKYIKGVPLPIEFIKIVTTPGWDIEQVAGYFRYYIECLEVCLKGEGIHFEEFSQHTVLPSTYLDAIPSNILIDAERQPRYFEREWLAKKGITLGNLTFRAALSLLGKISSFSPPANGRSLTRGEFIKQLFEALSFSADSSLFEQYLVLESELQVFSSGSDKHKLDTWYPEHVLPGLHALEQAESQEAERVETESALEEQRRAYGELLKSKDYAEKLAFERMDEIETLKLELNNIKSGIFWRISRLFRGKRN